MKVVHQSKDPVTEEWRIKATEHEVKGESAEATRAYEKLIKFNPLNSKYHDRLMILYRKWKEYKKELTIINNAIALFENNYRKRIPTFNKKITALSKALLKATGLADKKGNNSWQTTELVRWKKRKLIVLKRLHK